MKKVDYFALPISKMNITEQEWANIVRIRYRVFDGNTLIFYLVDTKRRIRERLTKVFIAGNTGMNARN